jgi:hypothetical protein
MVCGGGNLQCVVCSARQLYSSLSKLSGHFLTANVSHSCLSQQARSFHNRQMYVVIVMLLICPIHVHCMSLQYDNSNKKESVKRQTSAMNDYPIL